MFGDVPEQREPGRRVKVFIPEDLADEPHQLALQYSALGRPLRWPVADPGLVRNCCGAAGCVPGRHPLRGGGLPLAVTQCEWVRAHHRIYLPPAPPRGPFRHALRPAALPAIPVLRGMPSAGIVPLLHGGFAGEPWSPEEARSPQPEGVPAVRGGARPPVGWGSAFPKVKRGFPRNGWDDLSIWSDATAASGRLASWPARHCTPLTCRAGNP
jgi:hypothetical protein